jgi:predicted TPR repeat methyltransferase
LAVDANYFPALRGLAQALPADSEHQVLVLQEALALRQDTFLVQMLGEHFERAGKPGRARSVYERALQDHPNDRHLRAFLARVGDAESSDAGAAQQEDAPAEAPS